MQQLCCAIKKRNIAQNVQGVTVSLSGHWIPEEQPQFVIKQLVNFFGKKMLLILANE
jgi:pimeloyl-ACP methyl ester carboxylesterase